MIILMPLNCGTGEPTMDNLIYRNVLIDELKKIKFPCMLPSGAEYLDGIQTAVRRISGVINDVPAVNSWIPVSERLPENEGRYLCSMYYAIPPYHLLHPENDTYIREVSIQYFDGKSFIASVIAWMPMPDAYKPPSNTIGD
jgi:hypothetical protein